MSMAEQKYELALISTKTNKKMQKIPWYKERLNTTMIKSRKPTDISKSLIGRHWLFLKDGLDDFQDGLPPHMDGDVTFKGSNCLGPLIKNSSENLFSMKRSAVQQQFNKHQMCYSHITPMKQHRWEYLNQIEYGLTQHPLALYPHLEESVEPKLFEDIMNILDPEMNTIDDDDSYSDEEENDIKQKGVTIEKHEPLKKDVFKTEQRETEGIICNPYQWISKKEQEWRNKKKTGEKPEDTALEEQIKNVTKDFCDWVANLGGQNNNIEESTITSLFASGYETKPALSIPIHVVELTNVPPELQMLAAVPQQQQNRKHQYEEHRKTKWNFSGQYEPSWVKYKYGAWYLDPTNWQKRHADQPLLDPKHLKDKEMTEAKKVSMELNNDLANIHGVNLFKEFVDKKSHRKPEFLDEVDEIKKQAELEEKCNIEAELTSKKKPRIVRKTRHHAKSPAKQL